MSEKMKKMYRSCGLFALIVIVLSSCSTLSFSSKEETIMKVVELINFGDPEILTGQSNTPFLLDGEILLSAGTIGDFWQGFRDSGYLIKDARPVIIAEVGEADFSKFSSSREVEVFFSKYLVEQAVCVDLEASGGIFYLLLGKKRGDYPVILGIRGPVR